MARGPQGQRRPADVIGAAIMVGRIATGEISDNAKSGRVKSKSLAKLAIAGHGRQSIQKAN